MGAESKQPFGLANAASAALDDLNGILVEVKAVKGADSWLKLRIKRSSFMKKGCPLQTLRQNTSTVKDMYSSP